MEMRYDASLVLVNNHFSIGYPRPLLPAMVEVGGLHVQHSVTPLPKDLQFYLDEATEGAVYFAMGSNLRNDAMATEKMASILSAFAEFPLQRVLMKWESKAILPSQLPSNVRLGKWLPQQSVLGTCI
jgi:glucuronosyltransferase